MNADALERARRVRLMLFDVDGVLTDGTLYLGASVQPIVMLNLPRDHQLYIKAYNDSRVDPVDRLPYIVVVIVNYLASRLQYVQLNAAGEGFLRILRTRVFAHIQRQSMAFFDREKAGVLVARMTADVESMSELVQFGLMQFISSFLLLMFALFLLLSMSWELTLITLIVFPFIIGASVKFQRDANKAYLEVREKVGANLSALQEGITGVRVIQAYARRLQSSLMTSALIQLVLA